MTCVVAVTDGLKVKMGSDSAAANDDVISQRVCPKVFVRGEFGIGYCYSFRLGQIIEYFFEPPKIDKDVDLMRYMVTKFVPALKVALEENDYPYHEDEKDRWMVLVGIRGKIFCIESDFQVGLDAEEVAAIGAGAELALGAMFVSLELDYELLEIAELGLTAAAKFSPFVIEPFLYIEV